MIAGGINAFSGKRVLMLQGPVGPFFPRLALDLESIGATVTKVNFNGGGWIFAPKRAVNFRGRPEQWPAFFENLLDTLHIDIIMLFGDCRTPHRVAHEIAHRKGVDIGVFEEGYVRPDYITFEHYGVNGYSLIPRSPIFYLNTQPTTALPTRPVGKTFGLEALWAISYYVGCTLLWPWFRHYKHHRPLTLLDGVPWIRSYSRKLYYAFKERGMWRRLTKTLARQYFLVPLQVYNDSQIHVHSDFGSVAEFIEHVVISFASHAPEEAHLVFKHHPRDRGYNDYSSLLTRLAQQHDLAERLHYIHDQHLPSLLRYARGVVTVNSTVGMSAIHHGAPLKVCGRALYDMKGLTFTGSLDTFWKDASHTVINRDLYKSFRNYLIERTQINGSFYKRLDIPGSFCGMKWGGMVGVFHDRNETTEYPMKQEDAA